jgi:hypothetical protein
MPSDKEEKPANAGLNVARHEKGRRRREEER